MQNPFDRRGNRGLGDNQVKNRLVGSWVWELPFWARQSSLPAKILGGWKFAGIGTIQSGLPFTVTSGKDNSLTGVNADRPNLLGDPSLDTGRPTSQRISRYFDTTQFAVNLPGQYGNAGRNILIGPGTIAFDLSLGKYFAITERKRVQFRWEAFNSLNRANFSNPNGNFSGGKAFGQITGAAAGRTQQLALRFEF